jgi:hypothetical protein
MKIITAQPFFNEIDLMQLKMSLLVGRITTHVVVEGNLTFTGQPKELIWPGRLGGPRLGRDVHYRVCELPAEADSPWVREGLQYAAVRAAVKELDPDIVLWLDADEIPRPDVIDRFIKSGVETATLEMDHLLYDFGNLSTKHKWTNAKIGWYRPDADPQPWRGMTGLPVITGAGWHCESFGGRERILTKTAAFSHAPEQGCIDYRARVAAGELPGMEDTAPYPFNLWPRSER